MSDPVINPVIDLAVMIRRVQQFLDHLPPLAGRDSSWSEFIGTTAAHTAALEQALRELRFMHGAQGHFTSSHSTIALLNVRASSRAGGADMLQNWVLAARQRLHELTGETP